MPADLIFYALIAAGLVFWLKNTLGTRHGEERDRPNPYASEAHKEAAPSNVTTLHGDDYQELSGVEIAISALKDERLAVIGDEAKQGLIDIAAHDKDFDLMSFLNGAQDAFVMIVEAFGAADKDTLKGLLAEPVFSAFSGAIEEREKAGQRMETEIHAIKRAEIIDAKLDKKTAFVTMRFIASETSVTYGEGDEIVSGHPDATTDMRDMWVFARDIKSSDPRWLVHETKGDFEDDNESIPNTDGSDE